MSTRQFALALGVIFIGVGVLGFIPGINQMHDMNHDTNLSVTGPGTGMLLGLFHVNLPHNLVHILFGVLGVAAAYGGWSRGYCQFVAIAYGLLAVLGLIPTANVNHTFGLIPIEGHDVWLHALIAILAAIFGWGMRATTAATSGTTDTAGAPRM